jgi:hypothetical protein
MKAEGGRRKAEGEKGEKGEKGWRKAPLQSLAPSP